jgi:hypothetical protein
MPTKNKFFKKIKQSAINSWILVSPSLKKHFSLIKEVFKKLLFYINIIFVSLGILLIVGFYYNIITLNKKLTTRKAVILYRSKLPKKLNKKENKEWSEITILEKKLNKISNTYQLYLIKKMKPQIPKQKKQ